MLFLSAWNETERSVCPNRWTGRRRLPSARKTKNPRQAGFFQKHSIRIRNTDIRDLSLYGERIAGGGNDSRNSGDYTGVKGLRSGIVFCGGKNRIHVCLILPRCFIFRQRFLWNFSIFFPTKILLIHIEFIRETWYNERRLCLGELAGKMCSATSAGIL